MTRRTALAALLLVVAFPAPGSALAAELSSSLTIFSRPDGASFRISGDQELSGQTPITFSPWLPGRYRIEGYQAGYDRWRRGFVFDAMSTDTIWITLRQKNALKAAGRALVLPGWGQWYDEHPRRGLVFLAGVVAAGVGTGVANWRCRNRWDDLRDAITAFESAQTGEERVATGAAYQAASERVLSAERLRSGFIWAGVGIWGLGLIDAVAFVPRPQPAGAQGSGPASQVMGAAETRFAMTLVRARF